MIASLSFSFGTVSGLATFVFESVGVTDNIDDDAREQLALLMLVWTFLSVPLK
jgi:hypothetical protein